MPDVFPPDFSSPVGRVRKYLPDLVQLPDPQDPIAEPSYLWSDEDIQSFIDDQRLDLTVDVNMPQILRAAAYLMIATGNNELLILKKLTTEDLETDGPAVQKQLLAAAQGLFTRAALLENQIDNAEVFIEIPYYPDFSSGRSNLSYGYNGYPGWT